MRPWQVWIVFGFCLIFLGTVVGWISHIAFRLEQSEMQARAHAVWEESIRLALWRMESFVSPIVARENTHPYFFYTSFYSAERAYTRMFAKIKGGEVLIPSPLLTNSSAYVLLHFQFSSSGDLTSPQVPLHNMRDLAEMGYLSSHKIEMFSARLHHLGNLLGPSFPKNMEGWVEKESEEGKTVQDRFEKRSSEALEKQESDDSDRKEKQQAEQSEWQQRRNSMEMQARAKNYWQMNVPNIPNGPNGLPVSPKKASNISGGLMKPLWIGESLFLARRVHIQDQEYLQGCWIDWPKLRRDLLEEIRDLCPYAQIESASSNFPELSNRNLSTLPVRLVPGEMTREVLPVYSPVRFSLWVAWGGMSIAFLAVFALLWGTVSLSERRSNFVSAVTHELRTPLTTLRMYAEMLAEGMLKTEGKKHLYLRTLSLEADRLGLLVENVLAYARLERKKTPVHRQKIELGEFLRSIGERLAERGRQAGMSLKIDVPEGMPSVQTDPSVVERIIFNLVDNACKYASCSAQKEIEILARLSGQSISLSVQDYGPGISPKQRGKLFRPFCKSSEDAARTAPGVGLGLALSKRLALHIGADLRYDRTFSKGSCFVLMFHRSSRSRFFTR